MRPSGVSTRAEPATVALTPDEPLVVRRDELAVVHGERSVGRVVEQRVVDRARLLGIDLVHAGDEPDAVFAGDLAEPALGIARHLERLAAQSSERLLRARIGPACERLRPARRRVRGHERLREDHELRAFARRLGGVRRELVDRPVAVQDHGLDLHARDANRFAHRYSRTTRSPTAISPSVRMSAFRPARWT